MTPPRRHHGFTLIELLVIVSIIAIALMIMLTGLQDLFASGAANKAENVIDAQLSMARSLAIRDRCYTGVLFQPDAKDPNVQWAVIIQEALQDPINPVYQLHTTGGRPSLVPTNLLLSSVDLTAEEARLRSWGPQDARRLFVQIRSHVTYSGRGVVNVTGTPNAVSLRLQAMVPGTLIRIGDFINISNVGYRVAKQNVLVPATGMADVDLVPAILPGPPIPLANPTLDFQVESSGDADIPPARLPEGVVIARGEMYSACETWGMNIAAVWPGAAPWRPNTMKTLTTFVILFAPDGQLVTTVGDVVPRFISMPDVANHNEFCADMMFCWRNRTWPSPPLGSETWQFLDPRGSLDQMTVTTAPYNDTVPVTAVRLVSLRDLRDQVTTAAKDQYLTNSCRLLPVGPYVGGLLRPQ